MPSICVLDQLVPPAVGSGGIEGPLANPTLPPLDDAPDGTVISLKVIGASIVYEPAGTLTKVNVPSFATSAVPTSAPYPKSSRPAGINRSVRFASTSAGAS